MRLQDSTDDYLLDKAQLRHCGDGAKHQEDPGDSCRGKQYCLALVSKPLQVLSFQLEDKPRSFAGSKEWIGSVEVMMVIDKICDVPCKILHARKGKDLDNLFDQVLEHLKKRCCPIMMGGDLDCSSKGIFGACITASDDKYFLILDPHFVKNKDGPETPEHLIEAGWAK